MSCEHCQGMYGIEVDEGEFECPMCGGKAHGRYDNNE